MAGLETNSEYSETAQAVSLGLAVLRKCKQNSWEELVAAMAADDVTVIKAFQALDLDEDQLELIGRRQPEIGLIRITPAVVPAICPACGMFILTSDAAPSKCQLTAGCEGKPAKVAAAKATKAAPKPVEPAPAPETDDGWGADMPVEEAVEALEAAVDGLHNYVAEKAAADEAFHSVAEAVVAEYEAREPREKSLSLEDLAEDFSDAPVSVPAFSRILQDDNDFD